VREKFFKRTVVTVLNNMRQKFDKFDISYFARLRHV